MGIAEAASRENLDTYADIPAILRLRGRSYRKPIE
jgi:hypothetical protein